MLPCTRLMTCSEIIQKEIVIWIQVSRNTWHLTFTSINAPPNSLIDSTISPKMKTTKEEGVGVRSLVHSTSRVERCAGALGW
jgi:hypothetical protein